MTKEQQYRLAVYRFSIRQKDAVNSAAESRANGREGFMTVNHLSIFDTIFGKSNVTGAILYAIDKAKDAADLYVVYKNNKPLWEDEEFMQLLFDKKRTVRKGIAA